MSGTGDAGCLSQGDVVFCSPRDETRLSLAVRGTDLTPGTAITTVTLQPKVTGSKVNTYYQATHQFTAAEA